MTFSKTTKNLFISDMSHSKNGIKITQVLKMYIVICKNMHILFYEYLTFYSWSILMIINDVSIYILLMVVKLRLHCLSFTNSFILQFRKLQSKIYIFVMILCWLLNVFREQDKNVNCDISRWKLLLKAALTWKPLYMKYPAINPNIDLLRFKNVIFLSA